MSRREVIRKALEEDWGGEEDASTTRAARSARSSASEASPAGSPEDAEVERLLADYRERRRAGHQAGCVCQSRDGRLGCVELRQRLAKAGEWQALYASP